MTIKQLHEITPAKTIIYVGMAGNCHILERDNPVDLEVYGRYVIARITAAAENEIEADVKITYVTEDK